jgi:hypothetical protein
MVKRLDSFATRHVTLANIREETDRNGLHVTVLHLPHTKASPGWEDISWAGQHGPTNPYQALENHRCINDSPIDGHLYAYKWKSSR